MPSDHGYSGLRRRLVAAMSIMVGGFAATIVGVPVIGFLLTPLIEPVTPAWRSVGAPSQFPVGSTTLVKYEDPSALPWSGVSGQTAAWLRRVSEQQFEAFSIDCTHLGCPVRWEEGAKLFMCPCHGGVYYANGQVAAGPPPLPLPRYPVRVQAGQVQVQAVALPIPSNEHSQYSNYLPPPGPNSEQ